MSRLLTRGHPAATAAVSAMIAGTPPHAILIAGPSGRWGALDRKGRPFIAPELPSRQVVMEELDRLLADTKPVL